MDVKDTAENRYESLSEIKEHYLDRGRECSELTIPTLIPENYQTQSSDFYSPFQSVGSRGVNNLASKLLLLLLPPNQPFFRLTLDEFTLSELSGRDDMKGEFEKALLSYEDLLKSQIGNSNYFQKVV